MNSILRSIVAAAAIFLAPISAWAQGPGSGPGPGPTPDPWIVNGNQINPNGFEVVTAASKAANAGFNLPYGAAPTSCVNGDLWTSTSGLFVCIGGSAIGPLGTETAPSITVASTQIISGTPGGVLFNNAGVLGNTGSANNGVLVTSNSGVPSIATTLPSGLAIPAPTISGTWAGNATFSGNNTFSGTTNFTGTLEFNGSTMLPVPQGGTGAATWTAGLPILGNGTSALEQGTVTGNTTEFPTWTGVVQAGQCVTTDPAATGNLKISGAACGAGNNAASAQDFIAGAGGCSGFTPGTTTAVTLVNWCGTASASGTTLTVSATSYGALAAGQTVAGTGITGSPTIVSGPTTCGGNQCYVLSSSQTASSESMTAVYTPTTATLVFVSFDGVLQSYDTFSISGATVTFDAAIPTNTQVVDVRWYAATTLAGVPSVNGLYGVPISITNSDGTLTVTTASPNITVAVNQSHSFNWQVVQSFSADVQFCSGRPWSDPRCFGALANGVTDDTTAITNALNALANLPGGLNGRLYMTAGTYCSFTGITIPTSFIYVDAESQGVTLETCGHNATALTSNYAYTKIENLIVAGYNSASATAPALIFGPNCAQCTLIDAQVQWGNIPFDFEGTTGIAGRSNICCGYGGANLLINGGGGGSALYVDRVSVDGNYFGSACNFGFPAGFPNRNAWTANTVVTTCQLVTTGGFTIMYLSGGTTAGTAPNLTAATYGPTYNDGSATYTLLSAASSCGLQVQSSFVNFIRDSDLSGQFDYALCLVGITGEPQGTSIQTSTLQALVHDLYAQSGAEVHIVGNQFGGCVIGQCSGINFEPSWSGDAQIVANQFNGNWYGLQLGAGTDTLVVGNSFAGYSGAGITVKPGISRFVISGNSLGSSTWAPASGTIGVQIQTGGAAQTQYNITNNDCANAPTCVSDNSAGTSKTVSGNN